MAKKNFDWNRADCPLCQAELRLKPPEGCSSWQLSEPARGEEVKAVTSMECNGPVRHLVKVYWTKQVFIAAHPD
jgi:hypothetical protein